MNEENKEKNQLNLLSPNKSEKTNKNKQLFIYYRKCYFIK